MIKDRIADNNVRLSDVISSLITIFSLTEEEMMVLFDKWADSQSILLNNRLVEIQEHLYKNGVDIQLTPHQINMLMEDEEYRNENFNFIPY